MLLTLPIKGKIILLLVKMVRKPLFRSVVIGVKTIGEHNELNSKFSKNMWVRICSQEAVWGSAGGNH